MRHLLIAAMICSLAAASFAQRKVPPPDGYVLDADTAIKIAVVVWSRLYGEREIAAQKPYEQSSKTGFGRFGARCPKIAKVRQRLAGRRSP